MGRAKSRLGAKYSRDMKFDRGVMSRAISAKFIQHLSSMFCRQTFGMVKDSAMDGSMFAVAQMSSIC